MAGTSAATTLRHWGVDVAIDLLAAPASRTYNRTPVNREVVIGLLEPEQAAPPDCGLDTTADTTRGIDPRTRQVHLDSGATARATR